MWNTKRISKILPATLHKLLYMQQNTKPITTKSTENNN